MRGRGRLWLDDRMSRFDFRRDVFGDGLLRREGRRGLAHRGLRDRRIRFDARDDLRRTVRPLVALFVETRGDHVLPTRRNQHAGIGRRIADFRKPRRNRAADFFANIRSVENRTAREQMEKQRAHAIDIVGGRRRGAIEQLRTQRGPVRRVDLARVGFRQRVLHDAADAEICEQQSPRGRDEHIVRREIAVRELDAVRFLEHHANLIEPRLDVLDFKALRLRQQLREAAALERLHRHGRPVRPFHQIINAQNARMDQRPIALDLEPQLLDRRRVPRHARGQKVQRHFFSEHLVLRDPDRVSAAGVQRVCEQITAGELLGSGKIQR